MKTDNIISWKETKSRFLSLSLPVNRRMGKVHSVFQTSFNVVVDGRLFNFSQEGMSLSAHGCILDRKTMNGLLEACKPGDLVRVNEEVFSFYTSKGVLKADVSTMEEIDLSIPRVSLSIRVIQHSPLYKGLAQVTFDEKIGLQREGKVKEALNTLEFLSRRSEEEKKQAIGYLIGRGKGLTPSGDDMLVGFTMIRKAFLTEDAFEQLFQEGTDIYKTTDISQAYFSALFAGYVSSLFVSLIASVENDSLEEVTKVIERIGKYGHTSGYDTLFGVYLGLQSLINDMEE